MTTPPQSALPDLYSCPVCGQPPGPVVVSESGHQACRCPGCGAVFVSPRPPPSDVLAIYEHDASQTAARLHIAKTRHPRALAHARFTLDLIAAHQEAGEILELGAGGGLLLAQARERGYRVHAIEPNALLAKHLQGAGVPTETAPLGPSSFGGARFDLLYHCNVLSHLSDPPAALAAMYSALRPGGLLVFETGNFADVHPRYHDLIRRTERFQLPEHLVFFGKASLLALLNDQGFRVLASHGFSRVPDKRAPRLLRALGLGRLLPRLRFFLTYRMGRIFPKRGRPQTLIIVAQRGLSGAQRPADH